VVALLLATIGCILAPAKVPDPADVRLIAMKVPDFYLVAQFDAFVARARHHYIQAAPRQFLEAPDE
jgi:hypothetical protein